MLELYHASMSVCSEKVRMVLAEKGQDFVSHHFNLREGKHQTPEYMKLNPNAVVPTLVHDGRPVIESNVIAEYLDEVFADPPLRPATPLGRAAMRVWTKQLDESLHGYTAVISVALAFRYQYLEKTAEEREALFARMVDPVRRERQREMVERGVDSPQFAPAIRRFAKMVADMDAVLREQPWLAGPDISLADIAFVPYVTRLEHLGMGLLWEARPAVPAWLDRMRARPSYDVALSRWFVAPVVRTMGEKGAAAAPRVRQLLGG